MKRTEADDNRTCSRCGGPRDTPGQRWCRACRNAHQRERRAQGIGTYANLSDEQRKRANARAIAGVYRRRGKLTPEPCERCGAEGVEMHHEDYSRPLAVTWLCKPCHAERHRELDAGAPIIVPDPPSPERPTRRIIPFTSTIHPALDPDTTNEPETP